MGHILAYSGFDVVTVTVARATFLKDPGDGCIYGGASIRDGLRHVPGDSEGKGAHRELVVCILVACSLEVHRRCLTC